MTVSDLTRKLRYNGNGVSKNFSVTFGFFEIAVFVNGILMAEGVDYTITQSHPGETGTVVFGTAPVSGTGNVAIVGNTEFKQPTDYQDNDEFPADTFERSLDREMMAARENYDRIGQTIRAPFFDPSIPELHFKDNPDTALGVDGTGTPGLFAPDDPSGPFGSWLSDGQAAAAAADASADAAAISAAAALASELAAASSESSAAASESNAATSESNAATSEGNASTSESNAAGSAAAALASELAAATSEGNAATSESNASTSAGNAATSEGNAAGSASAAYASELAAAASAGNAATSESNAAASASAAYASELAAAASASSALQNVVEDTTPQLGGDLDSNGKKILLDANFYLGWSSGNPFIPFDTSDAFIYDRTNNALYLNIGGATKFIWSASALTPGANDGGSLGTTGKRFSDGFLATGAVLDWGGDFTFTHSAGYLTANKDLRITTPGTNAASVVTTEGTQTLKNKTLDYNSNTFQNFPTAGRSYIDAVYDYGVVANGSTDDTTALQNAINAAISAGKSLALPGGAMKISSALTITGPIHIFGQGATRTFIRLATATQYGLNVSTTSPIYLADFCIEMQSGVTATAGGGILMDPTGSNVNLQSVFRGMRFVNTYQGIIFQRAAYWSMHSCTTLNCVTNHLLIRNLVNDDEGDSTISDCMFTYNAAAPTSANLLIVQNSGGGLKINNCKITGGYRGYQGAPATGVDTLGPIITGCSFENQSDSCILLTGPSDTGAYFRRTVITGNEIASFGDGYGIRVAGVSNKDWLRGITITGNTIATGIDGTGTGAGRGISMDYATGVAICGNVLDGQAANGGGGSATGILLSANVVTATLTGNVIKGFTTPTSDSST